MKTPLVCAALTLLAFAEGCRHREVPIVRETAAMDTYVTVTVYDDNLPAAKVNAAIDTAFSEIHRIERFASDYIDTSEIGRANSLAGKDSLVVSRELAALIRRSLAYSDSSDGAFDITVGPLEVLWNILAPHPRVPSPDSVRIIRQLVGYRLVSLHGNTLYLPKKGMRLDLGAIGKGYAVDKAMDILKDLKLIQPDNPEVYYNIACLYAKQNMIDKSIDYMKQAIKKGFHDWDLIKNDPDLANMRNTAYLNELIKIH